LRELAPQHHTFRHLCPWPPLAPPCAPLHGARRPWTRRWATNDVLKTEAMYFPPPRQAYAAADTSRFLVDGTGFVEFSKSFKYLGSVIHYSLTSDADICKRIKSATAAFWALKNLFGDKYLSEKVKGQVYTALVLSTLLYGCEVLVMVQNGRRHTL
jgi:hypothetical protein